MCATYAISSLIVLKDFQHLEPTNMVWNKNSCEYKCFGDLHICKHMIRSKYRISPSENSSVFLPNATRQGGDELMGLVLRREVSVTTANQSCLESKRLMKINPSPRDNFDSTTDWSIHLILNSHRQQHVYKYEWNRIWDPQRSCQERRKYVSDRPRCESGRSALNSESCIQRSQFVFALVSAARGAQASLSVLHHHAHLSTFERTHPCLEDEWSCALMLVLWVNEEGLTQQHSQVPFHLQDTRRRWRRRESIDNTTTIWNMHIPYDNSKCVFIYVNWGPTFDFVNQQVCVCV